MTFICALAVLFSLCIDKPTTFGIIYSTHSKMIRSIVLPDHDWELFSFKISKGETMMVIPRGIIKNPIYIPAVEELVFAGTGVSPASGAAAVIDESGRVIALI